MQTTPMLIGGEPALARSGATFERRNPLDGSVASRAAAATATDALAAAQAFPAWAAFGPAARRKALTAAAAALEARAEAFVAAMAAETGTSAIGAHFNVHLAADMLREAAALTTQITGTVIPSDVPGSQALAVRQPAGVVLGMAPWNAPVILPFGGVKGSGWGHFGGQAGIAELPDLRWITVQTAPRSYPF